MSKYSDTVNWDSADGLPSNPFPNKPIIVACKNEDCAEDVDTEICPFCGTENLIEYEPDYEAGDKENED